MCRTQAQTVVLLCISRSQLRAAPLTGLKHVSECHHHCETATPGSCRCCGGSPAGDLFVSQRLVWVTKELRRSLKGSGLGKDFEDAEAASADQRGSFEFHVRCVLVVVDVRLPRCPGVPGVDSHMTLVVPLFW